MLVNIYLLVAFSALAYFAISEVLAESSRQAYEVTGRKPPLPRWLIREPEAKGMKNSPYCIMSLMRKAYKLLNVK